MAEHEKADEARKGLVDSIKGKAKEVVGAVIKNDELTAQGQVEQAQARERREASRLESVADAEETQAKSEVAEAKWQGAEERVAANEQTRAQEDAIARDQAAQKKHAQEAGARDAAKGQMEAEEQARKRQQQANAEHDLELNAAEAEVADALDGRREAVHEAAAARAEAERIRQRADGLSDTADVPREENR
jgi:uncharacterized protein YjbJ (UPF0337 family)